MINLSSLFSPRSVAVFGASPREDTMERAVFINLLRNDFTGVVYPVSPVHDSIHGVKCYRSLAEISNGIDLAILMSPPDTMSSLLEECGARGVKAAIIVSGGFREIGLSGLSHEQDVQRIATKWGMAVMGPNCLGIINTDPSVRLNASFSAVMPREGGIAFLSQCGGLCAAALELASNYSLGFSKFISMGNEAVLTEVDILRYLATDNMTSLVLMYVEDISDPRTFVEVAREITGGGAHPKPILVVKSGRTPEGGRAAASHTGSLVGPDGVYDALFEQAGVIRVDTIEELYRHALAFSKLPLPRGNRVAIITNAGGPGIMAVDMCTSSGLELARLAEPTLASLKMSLPGPLVVTNPVQLGADAQRDRYDAAITAVMGDPGVDASVVILTPHAMTGVDDIARAVVQADRRKPLAVSFMGVSGESQARRILSRGDVPQYSLPESAVRALAAMSRHAEWRSRPRTDYVQYEVNGFEAERVISSAWKRKADSMTGTDADRLLAAYGFQTLSSGTAIDGDSAAALARQIGFPVALKVLAKNVVTKFDVGGVRLHLRNEQDVRDAAAEIRKNLAQAAPKAVFESFMVQQMAPPGKEVIIGMKRDPHFGAVMMFGMGGVYVEALHDVTFRLPPLRERVARRMVESLRTFRVLTGVRGEPPSDIDAIVDGLMRFSQLVMEHPEIVEMDINPLFVYPKGTRVVDSRVVFSWEEAAPKVKERVFLPRERMGDFVSALAATRSVFGPRAKDNCFVFGKIDDPADLRLDYDTTILPPKKFFFRHEEPLIRFTVAENRAEVPAGDGEAVILGVHPCDLIGIGLLDKVFAESPADPYYRRHRESSYLVGLNCVKKCNEFSYCDAMVSYTTRDVYDLMLTAVDGGYAVDVGTDKGARLLESVRSTVREVTAAEYAGLKRFEEDREKAFSARPVDFTTLRRDLWRSYNSPLWSRQAELCFSCGVCNVVCPTCYCFDVCEETDLGGSCGERTRVWDGCMLKDFTEVTTGEVFREHRDQRLRHRELRKGLYKPEKFGFHTFCVGCGRCVKNCLVRISPLESFVNAQKERA